jgi:ABC-type bacteriocin/lantibiotic exporter with double-glycine peptidase domain
MKTKYHIEITHNALQQHFSAEALNTIIKANIAQDRIKFQFGHDYIHFDSNAFAAGFEYIALQEKIIFDCVNSRDYKVARKAFGRLTHSWQDFYSHSNYVKLWLAKEERRSPEEIRFNDNEILTSLDLKSGKNYGVIEFVALLPCISKLVTPLMPEDSHAKMNLDSPTSGPHFAYAYWAAFKRTLDIYNRTYLQLSENDINSDQISAFHGQYTSEVKV